METPVFRELARCKVIWRCYSICLFIDAVRISPTIQRCVTGRVNTTDGLGRGFSVMRHYPGVCLLGERKAGLRTEIWTHELHKTVQWCPTLGRTNQYRLYRIAINMAYFWTSSNILGYPKQNAFRTGCLYYQVFRQRDIPCWTWGIRHVPCNVQPLFT